MAIGWNLRLRCGVVIMVAGISLAHHQASELFGKVTATTCAWNLCATQVKPDILDWNCACLCVHKKPPEVEDTSQL